MRAGTCKGRQEARWAEEEGRRRAVGEEGRMEEWGKCGRREGE